jgi:hypothetical protein
MEPLHRKLTRLEPEAIATETEAFACRNHSVGE